MSEQELNQVIANNISFLLQTKGKSQSELADYMNVSQATVSNWCKGIKTPRMDKIDKIAVFFNVNRSRIMEEIKKISLQLCILWNSLMKKDKKRLLSLPNLLLPPENIKNMVSLSWIKKKHNL